MEHEHSESGWSYLPPRAGRPAVWFSWTISVNEHGPGRAVLWIVGPIPEVIEVEGPCALMAAMLSLAAARSVSDEAG